MSEVFKFAHNTITIIMYVYINTLIMFWMGYSETAKEHQTVTVDIFDKLGQLHNSVAWIHGEMSSIDMVIFYSIAIVLGYIGTSIPRTRGARFWLMIMFMLTIAAERKLHTYLTQPEYSYITPVRLITNIVIPSVFYNLQN